MKKETISIQQILHGYDEGHRLLAASCKLSTEAQQILIEQSDLSGASAVEGFSTYLSAFPLSEEGFFCISRTWEAPEMERPGCVWTHSLLISFSDLPNLDSLTSLKLPHRRPTTRKNHSGYGSSIELQVGIEQQSHLENHVAALIAEEWGKHSDNTLYISATTSKQFEEAIILMWCGQWPKLRRSFAFSTGSLRDRRGTSFDYDLQVFPQSELSLFKRSIRKSEYFLFHPPIFDGRPFDEWLIAHALRLLPNSKMAYDFVFKYGADISNPKSGLVALCSIFKLLSKKSKSVSQIISLAKSAFPSSEDGSRLKSDLIRLPNPFFSSREQLEILRLLRQGEIGEEFSPDANAIPEWVTALWPLHSSELLTDAVSVMTKGPSPRGGTFLEAISMNLRVADIGELRNLAPDSWMFFVAKNPMLAVDRGCWNVTAREKVGLLMALKGCHADGEKIFTELIAFLLNDESEQISEYTYKNLKESLRGAYRIWFNRHLEKHQSLPRLPISWQRVMRSASDTDDWRNSNEPHSSCKLVSSFLYLVPQDFEMYPILAADWESAYTLIAGLKDDDSKTECIFLLAGVGLSRKANLPIKVMLDSTRIAHRKLAQNEYSERAWQLIEAFLPRLNFWQEWDRCEKLRSAMVKFAEHEIHVFEKLAGTTKKKKIKAWVVDYISSPSS